MDDVTFIFEVHGKNKFLSSRRVSVEQDSMSNNKSENRNNSLVFNSLYKYHGR